MSVILEARNSSLAYRNKSERAVNDVSVQLSQGMSLGVVGESGSGKSSLAKLLAGVMAPTSGAVLVGGKDWGQIGRRHPARRLVQMIFQDPYGALNPWRPARDTVTDVFRHWEGVPRDVAAARAEELLDSLGVSRDAMRRRPGELSGGQCQRVGIARALACSPEVLIADEPTSALDVSVQAQILNLLVSLRESRGLAIVLISHDLAVVRYVTSSAVVMYRGSVIERGSTRDLLTTPAHPYTRILVDAIPGRSGGLRARRNAVPANHPCPFAARCPRLQTDCGELVVASDGAAGRYAACRHPLVAPPATVA